ncbi:uncharacterized protein BJ171DRAFT_528191 [Polychytrium aggregatum]|uniref:uncharacterized protein n=1 Tax=Polychytrium aggregatum TaxID=110093 RepID=UPI0022FEABEA|nr:uncharacterized protein BJ171DRAFT_528191 [Polychytrium aggregatum]KAI9193387.1 hypothetical protein BJ171DRAFT_528191 [Polychytrium aggregatum]
MSITASQRAARFPKPDGIPDPLKFIDRPARKQVSKPSTRTVNETSGTYNIWYGRYSGDSGRGQRLEKATTRCSIEKDAGYTKAANLDSLFCLHFARGCCHRGHECTYLHRLPGDTDRIEATRDAFGREKHREQRDDMGGVGSFETGNKTLYVGHVSATKDMEYVVRKHFGEWGELESVRCLDQKGVAFVQYKNVANAEFAKEAMYGQALDRNEVLNVRWASENPNPKAQETKKRKAQELAATKMYESLPVVGELGTVLDYGNYYTDPAGSYAYQGYYGNPQAGYYANDKYGVADGQSQHATLYSSTTFDPSQSTDPVAQEAYAKYWNEYYSYYGYAESHPEPLETGGAKKPKVSETVTEPLASQESDSDGRLQEPDAQQPLATAGSELVSSAITEQSSEQSSNVPHPGLAVTTTISAPNSSLFSKSSLEYIAKAATYTKALKDAKSSTSASLGLVDYGSDDDE